MQFDVESELDMFFEAHDTVRRDLGKLPIYEMSLVFYSTLVVGPSRKHGTLQNFFECCLSLEKDPDALNEITSLIYRPKKG